MSSEYERMRIRLERNDKVGAVLGTGGNQGALANKREKWRAFVATLESYSATGLIIVGGPTGLVVYGPDDVDGYRERILFIRKADMLADGIRPDDIDGSDVGFEIPAAIELSAKAHGVWKEPAPSAKKQKKKARS